MTYEAYSDCRALTLVAGFAALVGFAPYFAYVRDPGRSSGMKRLGVMGPSNYLRDCGGPGITLNTYS